ncbi:MAG TPA: hypothetical protein VK809_06285, partial [Bacteroidia bacterium]|nr:hypothetical protein [Bacteroidia bacterium]
MRKELNQINFNSLLIADDAINVDEYSFNEYVANGKTHRLKGYCTKCEEAGCNICPTNPDYKLSLVSHGASSDDIFQSTDTVDTNFSEWHKEGVLFLME